MVLAKVKKIRAKNKTRTKTNQISQPNSIGNQPDQGGPDAQVVDPVLSQALTVDADLCQVHHLVRALVILVDRAISAHSSQTMKKTTTKHRVNKMTK